ncbi:MAG: PH domain-containing protein, partial [Myxococcota bacterium]
MPSSVRRFFRLSDSVLYNHAQLTSKPTWMLSVSRSTVRADYDRNLIVLSCPKRHLRFQLATGAETHRWLIALRTAAMCNVNDFYTLGRTIGTGSFGTV